MHVIRQPAELLVISANRLQYRSSIGITVMAVMSTNYRLLTKDTYIEPLW